LQGWQARSLLKSIAKPFLPSRRRRLQFIFSRLPAVFFRIIPSAQQFNLPFNPFIRELFFSFCAQKMRLSAKKDLR